MHAHRRWLRFTFAIGLLIWAAAASAARFNFDATPGRLPKDVVPTHYTLAFDLDPAKATFAGHAQIDVTVRRAVSEIVLQATELTPVKVTVAPEGGAERDATVVAQNEQSFWRLRLPASETMAPGHWRVDIRYEGKVERRGQALYVVEYKTGPSGADARRLLSTQLEPSYARAVFPSFDEPAFRATFDVSITAPAQYEAVSNMPVQSQAALPDGRRTTAFSRTPSMPTYLLSLTVGEFDALSDTHEGVALRILTARGRSEEARFAMQATKQVLTYFGEYFGVPYMLPKLDQIAIPGVRDGAMEDWGAITYNEGLLLYDPARSAPRLQQLIYSILAHEVAHQWFGNYVTAAWWDDIWLNEAFATWMASKALDRFNPAWGARVRERRQREEALALDIGRATRAIADPPSHESVIFEVFDDITYTKGGAVLSMLEAQIGEDVFRDGLRRYMAAHRYSNAAAEDLWFHLSQAAGKELGSQIAGWVRQRGFPLVTAATTCKGGRTQVELSQQRFTAQSVRASAATWQVPVVLTAEKQTHRLVLGRDPQRVQFEGCVPVVANGGDIGYYRVQYDAGNRDRLLSAYATLPATERIGLVADTMALARAGRIPFADYFRLLDVLRGEPEGAIWEQVIESLTYLDDVFIGTPTQAALRAYSRALLKPQLASVGWQRMPSDSADTLRLRSALIGALGRFDDTETIDRARRLFSGLVASPSVAIEPSIRGGVLRTVARHADDATFESIRRLLRDARTQEDIYMYGDAMIRVRDPQLVRRVLQIALTDEWPPNAASSYVRHIGEASGNAAIARDFVLQNFDAIAAKSPRHGRPFILPGVYLGFNIASEAEALLVEQRRRVGVEAIAPAEQTAQMIREKSAVRTREQNRLAALLEKARMTTAAAPRQ